ncbi:Oxidoreductase [Madurella fahalii]|uniref:Oxidoreductase n=1 Tax=Madurella fahalii TaxID=1157608 RepID=A0ABQ0GNR6_9PEZI
MSHHQKLRVLVVGASIAGPTAAYWFAKAGAQVTVIERFPQLRVGGQAIDIRTVGVTVMRKMSGMEAAVRAKATPITGIRFVDSHCRAVATIEATSNPDQQSLVSEYEILRGDLAEILVDLTRTNENIRYIFGEQVASIEPRSPAPTSDNKPNTDITDNGPVTVTFINNTLPPTKFDLVVACDGSTSRTRALGFACPVRAHMRPINWWAAYFSIRGDPDPSLPLSQLHSTTLGQAYSAPGGRLIMAGPDRSPGVTRAAIMGIQQPAHLMASFREAQQQGEDALKSLIAEQFSSAGWLCPALIAGMLAASPDFYATEIVQVRPPSLYNLSRRVVLVGDAGYAAGPTGTGTSLALAGAYVLAGEVARHRGDLRRALAGYEQVMRPLVEELTQIPNLLGTALAPQTRWGVRVRNGVLWFVSWSGLLGWVQQFMAGAFKKMEEEMLPEYDWVE